MCSPGWSSHLDPVCDGLAGPNLQWIDRRRESDPLGGAFAPGVSLFAGAGGSCGRWTSCLISWPGPGRPPGSSAKPHWRVHRPGKLQLWALQTW